MDKIQLIINYYQSNDIPPSKVKIRVLTTYKK